MLDFPRWKVMVVLGAILLSVMVALPNVLPQSVMEKYPSFLPSRTVSLGLDLQGGSHLLLELEYEKYFAEQRENIVDGLRQKLREGGIGYRGLAVRDNTVVFTLREDSTKTDSDIEAIIKEVEPGLNVAKNGAEFVLTYSEDFLKDKKKQLLEQSLEIVNRRVNETGTKEPIIQRQGEDRVLLQVPGVDNPESLKKILGQTAKMTFHLLDESVSQADLVAGNMPAGTKIIKEDDSQRAKGDTSPLAEYPVVAKVLLSGELLTGAAPTFDQNNAPAVSFNFNTKGARIFGEITSNNRGKVLAIVLDNRVITAPNINEPIMGGAGIITGNFTVEETNRLALLLRAGALPVPLKVVEERTVGPSLGADSVQAGKKASFIAIAAVMFFMFIAYGLFGVFANLALMVNVIIIFAALSMFNATLTLPGIAGIVLTIGMAVDTNVLIYERIREEIRLGKSAFASVESGFKMAFATIIDSHVTTLIAALLLYYFGTGTVKGFAVTLCIGISSSMFTAVMVTRLMVVTWLKRTRPKVIPI